MFVNDEATVSLVTLFVLLQLKERKIPVCYALGRSHPNHLLTFNSFLVLCYRNVKGKIKESYRIGGKANFERIYSAAFCWSQTRHPLY